VQKYIICDNRDMEVQELGLRERKHAETRSRLEEAALSLVIKDGLEKTTIDAISEAAHVSPRTFFNYFDSKEDAVLGVYLTDTNESESTNALPFHPSDDIVTSVVQFMAGFVNPSRNSQRLKKKRVQLVREYPVLLDKQINRMTKINEALNANVQVILVTKYPELDAKSAAAMSEVIVMTCIGGVKIAVKEWLSSSAETLTTEVELRAIEIIKDTIKVL
jgi:AcrR family transcriptional regulator